MPASALPLLEPGLDGELVELGAEINGAPYRLLLERRARRREYGSAEISLSGRGRAALLAAPASPILTFGNAGQARTAQQLLADALTVNGVSNGWSVDWRVTDWLVPAGAWSHQGSYIDAAKRIAEAAGGYVQAHDTDAVLQVLARYPVPPWEWSAAMPDLELPPDVVTQEGIEWEEKAAYNRVFVSGAGTGGVLGQVTRAGTAGDQLAPMVTDPLMTHADAVRQRGRAILAGTGRQATVSLRLPVLSETGVIKPGRLVRYLDDTVAQPRLGLVRSTAVEAGAEVWQTIGVETHVS